MTKFRIISTFVFFAGMACGIWSPQVPVAKLTAVNHPQQRLAQSPFTSSDKDAPDSTISGTTRSGLRTFVRNDSA
ncbi:MAG: hypothetical protein HC799_04030 [Limnothrix sp. RL_2_0]|nr:hypothetical protein [Limnothrix sp. RL_2_0]